MNIILLGPQGSGKGTQAKFLVENFGFYYFETGAFLRDLAKKDKKINEIINVKGKLVPSEMFFPAMKNVLEKEIKEGKSVLFDGFPRRPDQYQSLKKWFDEDGLKIDIVILINISEEEAIKRLSSRRSCKTCGKIWNLATSPIPPSSDKCDCGGELFQRVDDKPEQIKERLEQYHKNTEPLLEIFRKEGILLEVDGERPIKEIQADLIKEINLLKNNAQI